MKFSWKRERLEIEVSGALEGAEVVCQVRDNGAGSGMAYAKQYEGAGIGLARGATFSFALPAPPPV